MKTQAKPKPKAKSHEDDNGSREEAKAHKEATTMMEKSAASVKGYKDKMVKELDRVVTVEQNEDSMGCFTELSFLFHAGPIGTNSEITVPLVYDLLSQGHVTTLSSLGSGFSLSL